MHGVLPVSLMLTVVLSGSASPVPLTGAAPPKLIITKLPPAVYPPIARAARVWGEVQVSLKLRADGTIASAEATSGPPMLRQPALGSVKQTQFQCKYCDSEVTAFTLTYKYEFVPGIPCSPHDDSYPRIAQSQNTITVKEQPVWLCDPGGYVSKRSLKCLYLWRCGRR